MAEDPADTARSIIDASLYMVLATADETGRAWVPDPIDQQGNLSRAGGHRVPYDRGVVTVRNER
jgi:hypothetical protein